MRKSKKKVWVVKGISESSDHYGFVVYKNKPDDKTLRYLCFSWDGDEEQADGPGDYGSYIYLTVMECEILNN